MNPCECCKTAAVTFVFIGYGLKTGRGFYPGLPFL